MHGKGHTSQRGPSLREAAGTGTRRGRCSPERREAAGVRAGGGVRTGRGFPPRGRGGRRGGSSRPRPRGGGGGEAAGAGRPGAGRQVPGLVRRAAAHLSPTAGAAGAAARPGRAELGAAGARSPERSGAAAEAGTRRQRLLCGPAGRSVCGSPGADGALRECGRRAGTTPLYRVGNSRRAPLPLTQRRPALMTMQQPPREAGAGPAPRAPIGRPSPRPPRRPAPSS